MLILLEILIETRYAVGNCSEMNKVEIFHTFFTESNIEPREEN